MPLAAVLRIGNNVTGLVGLYIWVCVRNKSVLYYAKRMIHLMAEKKRIWKREHRRTGLSYESEMERVHRGPKSHRGCRPLGASVDLFYITSKTHIQLSYSNTCCSDVMKWKVSSSLFFSFPSLPAVTLSHVTLQPHLPAHRRIYTGVCVCVSMISFSFFF